MIHVAADYDHASMTQRCARCGALLVGPTEEQRDVWVWSRALGHDVRSGTRAVVVETLFPRYRTGDIVEVSAVAHAIVFGARSLVNCPDLMREMESLERERLAGMGVS